MAGDDEGKLGSIGERISAVKRLAISIDGFVRDKQKLTPEEKQEEFKKITEAMPNATYTIRTAECLEKMMKNGEIADWYCVPVNFNLDQLKADFVVKTNRGVYVPLQITSQPTRGTERRNKIKWMYKSSFADTESLIPVIQLINVNLEPISDYEAFSRFRGAIAKSETAWTKILPQ